MTNIDKQEIIPVLLEYYSLKLKESAYKEHLFQKKYKHLFEDFEKYIKSTDKENFEAWDDYMEWKACQKTIQNYELKIKSIEHGDFQLA
jgi:hypothetical protein